MPELRGTYYDLLLFRIADRLAQDAHEDGDLDGDVMALYHAARPWTDDDSRFQDEYESIQKIEDPRERAYTLYGSILVALKKGGKLDVAPSVTDSGAMDFLSS